MEYSTLQPHYLALYDAIHMTSSVSSNAFHLIYLRSSTLSPTGKIPSHHVSCKANHLISSRLVPLSIYISPFMQGSSLKTSLSLSHANFQVLASTYSEIN
jgi:hypothetical protein